MQFSNVETTQTQGSGPGPRGKKLHLERVPTSLAPRRTAEDRFWKAFRFPVLLKQFGGVTHCEFSPVAPFDIAATSGNKITIIQPQSKEVKRELTRFRSTPFSGSYRKDGQLLVAGGATPIVQVFDAESRSVLRKFGAVKGPTNGHTGAVHVTRFALDLPQVLSGGDDKLALLWDIESGEQKPLFSFTKHTDYIRCAANSPSSPHCWLTGGYDHTVRLWDSRTGPASAGQTLLAHGAPVEDVLIFPNGTTVVTAGGSEVKIWDLLAGGQLLQTLTNHQKAVTCLAFDGARTRLLTGSIDRFIKIYDLNSLYGSATDDEAASSSAVLHSLHYPSPILSMALSPDDQHLVVGMADGVISVRTRPSTAAVPVVTASQRKTALKFHALGQHNIPSSTPAQENQRISVETSDYIVGQRFGVSKNQKIKPYERMLNKYQYYDALNAALASKDALIAISLMKELVRRRSIKLALSGRDEADLVPVLKLICKYIRNPRFSNFLTKIFELVLDIYSAVAGQSKEVSALLKKIQRKMHEELQLQTEIQKLMGVLDVYLAAM